MLFLVPAVVVAVVFLPLLLFLVIMAVAAVLVFMAFQDKLATVEVEEGAFMVVRSAAAAVALVEEDLDPIVPEETVVLGVEVVVDMLFKELMLPSLRAEAVVVGN